MKTLLFSASLALSTLSAHAADTQYIDCKFSNPASTDHVVVSLTDPQTGTFFYTSGIDDNGDDQNTGRLALKRMEEVKTDIKFSAKWSTVQDGDWVTVEFLFTMPKNLIFKASNSFKAALTSNIIDGEHSLKASDNLDCFAKLYPTTK